MNARESILERLRHARSDNPIEMPDIPADADLFTDMPDLDQLIDNFGQRLTDLAGQYYRLHIRADIAAKLKELTGNREFMVDGSALVEGILLEDQELQSLKRSMSDIETPESIDFGVTSAKALVARTGSIVLDSRGAGGRRLSVLPPVHIVIAETCQMVRSLEDAVGPISEADSSYSAIITGPSRTADIEKILVLGAHGPKRLIVLLLDE